MKFRKAVIATAGAALLSTGLATGISMSAHGINDIGRNNSCRDNRVNNNGNDAIYGKVQNSTKCAYRFRLG